MAGLPAPDTRLVAVRDVETKDVSFVLPIDAREMVASTGYELATDVAQPAPVNPLTRTAHQERMVEVEEIETGKTRLALPVDAKEMVKSGAYIVVSGPTPPADSGEPITVADEFPPIEQLAQVLAAVTDADVLLAMEAKDDRPEAKVLYEARFNELANVPRQ